LLLAVSLCVVTVPEHIILLIIPVTSCYFHDMLSWFNLCAWLLVLAVTTMHYQRVKIILLHIYMLISMLCTVLCSASAETFIYMYMYVLKLDTSRAISFIVLLVYTVCYSWYFACVFSYCYYLYICYPWYYMCVFSYCYYPYLCYPWYYCMRVWLTIVTTRIYVTLHTTVCVCLCTVAIVTTRIYDTLDILRVWFAVVITCIESCY
jgi:hypothetical protein